MDEQKFSLSGSFKKVREYIDTQIELLKLQAMARGSRMLGALIVDISKVIFVLIVVFFLAMALGFYLGEVMGSNALGFLSTGGIFLIILFLVIAFEAKIERKFIDIAVRKFYRKWNEEDEQTDPIDTAAGVNQETEPNLEKEEYERKDQ